jgi:hypothetical protein
MCTIFNGCAFSLGMTAPEQQRLPSSVDGLRAGLLGLVNVCPVEKCNPPDCPLFALRELDHRRRLEWFSALKEADLEYLAVYHYVCMNARLGTYLPSARMKKNSKPTVRVQSSRLRTEDGRQKTEVQGS